jgi:hypothetical protein
MSKMPLYIAGGTAVVLLLLQSLGIAPVFVSGGSAVELSAVGIAGAGVVGGFFIASLPVVHKQVSRFFALTATTTSPLLEADPAPIPVTHSPQPETEPETEQPNSAPTDDDGQQYQATPAQSESQPQPEPRPQSEFEHSETDGDRAGAKPAIALGIPPNEKVEAWPAADVVADQHEQADAAKPNGEASDGRSDEPFGEPVSTTTTQEAEIVNENYAAQPDRLPQSASGAKDIPIESLGTGVINMVGGGLGVAIEATVSTGTNIATNINAGSKAAVSGVKNRVCSFYRSEKQSSKQRPTHLKP